MQETHTARGVDLAAVAQACGFARAMQVREPGELAPLRAAVHAGPGPLFAQIKVAVEKLPLVLPPREGSLLKGRFRRALLGEGGDLD